MHFYALIEKCRCRKKAFTLSCFLSRTSGAAPDQNEERMNLHCLSPFRRTQIILCVKLTHLGELLHRGSGNAFNPQLPGRLVIWSLQVLEKNSDALNHIISSLQEILKTKRAFQVSDVLKILWCPHCVVFH